MIDPRALRRFRRNPGARVGAAIVAALVAFALLGPLFVGQDPNASDFDAGRTAAGTPAPPGTAHWLGTDNLFRDVLARLADGARLSLEIAMAATAISIAIGAAVGIAAGWFRRLDGPLMRLVDVGLCFPFLLLVMAIGAALDRTTEATILVVLGLTGWLGTARLVRAKTIQVRDLDFVVASRALGQRTATLLLRHVLPNLAGPLVVVGTASVAQMILAESVLSYLNVGVQPPTPTWGRMLYEVKDYYVAAPWLVAAPGAAILASVLGFNLVGEGLRDALDPKEP